MTDQIMDAMMRRTSALWISWFLAVVVLVLAASALGKYLFSGNKRGRT
jgi:hypothetical protein